MMDDDIVKRTISRSTLIKWYEKKKEQYGNGFPEVKNPQAVIDGIIALSKKISGRAEPPETIYVYILDEEHPDKSTAEYMIRLSKVSDEYGDYGYALCMFYQPTKEMESVSVFEPDKVTWSPETMRTSPKHEGRTKCYLGFSYMVCDNSKGFDEEPEEEYELTGEDLIELGIEADLPKDMMSAADELKDMMTDELGDMAEADDDGNGDSFGNLGRQQVESLFGSNTNSDDREVKPWDEANMPTPLSARGEEPLPWNSVGMTEQEKAAMGMGGSTQQNAPTPLPARKETPGQIQARLDIHSGRNAERDAAEEEAIKQLLLERQRAEADGTASGANRSHEASTNEKLNEEENAYDDLMVDFEDFEDLKI